MKYLILSDSHGNIKNLEFAIKNSHYDKVLFLGDGLKDLKYNTINTHTLHLD